jgi:prolyl-tRNA synthetase
VAEGSAISQTTAQLYSELLSRNVEVLLDDRDERAGVKFKDSELIGIPVRIGIGEKSLAKGEVEIKIRGGALLPIKTEQAVAKAIELLKSLSAEQGNG